MVTSPIKTDYLLHSNLDRSVNNGKDVQKGPKENPQDGTWSACLGAEILRADSKILSN